MFKSVFNIAASLAGVVLTLCSIVQLSIFLSHIPYHDDKQRPKTNEVAGTPPPDNDSRPTEDDSWRLVEITVAMLVNISLLILFMFQHSILAHSAVKRFGMQVVERSIYVITTSLALLFLVKYWQPIPWVTLWQVNTSSDSQHLWWFFKLLHYCMWAAIYGGCMMRDVSELLGMKQVYYHHIGLQDPLTFKSTELCRLHQHKRHPSFLGFCVIFWIHPCMTLDRFLLAVIWTVYMVLAWNVDRSDFDYQERQLKKKCVELKR